MNKAHKIKLNPTKSQEVLLRKSCGVARFTYNWALSMFIEDYKDGVKWSAYSLIKYLNSIKKEKFPWMQETSKTCNQYAVHNVEKSFKNMWKYGSGYPKFKKKGVRDSFVAVENKEAFNQKNFKIHIPRIGKIKCYENLRYEGKVNNVVVKRIADMWFAIINIEVPNEMPSVCDSQATIGVDLGIKTMIVLSDGTIYKNPKSLKSNLKSLKRLHRGLSRKVNGSKNRKKQQMKIARKYYRISCVRNNAIHQATTDIVNRYDKIVTETLKPKSMAKNRCLSQSVSDASFGEISRQLAYKSQWAGKELVRADQWFPSSKLCSNCGHKKEKLELSERTYNCNNCGHSVDRDLNAAINLANYSPTSDSEGSKACRERSEPCKVQRASKKQEAISSCRIDQYTTGNNIKLKN